MSLETAVRQIHDFNSLVELFRQKLGWKIDPTLEKDDLSFVWRADHLNLIEISTERLPDGFVRQLRFNEAPPPWGIFFVEFADTTVYRTALRDVLRGLVAKARRATHLPAWRHGNLLFICTTGDYDRFTFAHLRGQQTNRAVIASFGWERGDTHIRTLCEFNLPALGYPVDPANAQGWLQQWRAAFDIETVTDRFFAEYRQVFETLEKEAKQNIPDAESCRLYTQRLFNRLMFLYFIQKKGWLSFEGNQNYLRALFNKAVALGENFLRDRLYYVFFSDMSHAIGRREAHDIDLLRRLHGDVVYLSGGLFDRQDEFDDQDYVKLSNEAFAPVLNLFERYHFTVNESTPLDVQVAVDPEMLGKVFEELVTGRHESGSYYTPRPIVSFMCREALKHYLAGVDKHAPAIARFVDEGDASQLKDAQSVLEALKRVRVCDPACGSGAYLLGMMQELLRLRGALFKSSGIDDESIYRRKREIIENNLYGVDKDRFAVQIACLRLWLSLAIESDKPQALPNLDFKIGCGDSLTAPAPSSSAEQLDLNRGLLVRNYELAKRRFMTCENAAQKKRRREAVERLRNEIAIALKCQPSRPSALGENVKEESEPGFDWAVEFAEVFTDQSATDAGGGFDIVLANPPYVRMERFKKFKPILKRNFPDVHSDRADLYVYFYDRARQLLKENGVGAFISPNKWLRAEYGEKLRQRLLDEQAFHLVVDFGDLPVFKATAYPAIFVWQKQGRGQTPTLWTPVRNLQACYEEGVGEHISRMGHLIPASQFGKGKARLANANTAARRAKMAAAGQLLGELVEGRIFYGIKTGLNEAFVINEAVRHLLIEKNPACEAIIKPLLAGDDVRRYELHVRRMYLIYAYHGVDISRYPAVEEHLKPFRQKLEARATRQRWHELQQPQFAYAESFSGAKIIYPQIMISPRFCFDAEGHFINQKCFSIAAADWYLLGVLNSAFVWQAIRENSPPLRGGYSEPRYEFMLTLSIPDARTTERNAIARLAERTQGLHRRRRQCVERFLHEIGRPPAESSSRNPLEQPWAISADEFTRRARGAALPRFMDARDETDALTEQIIAIERELDERVAALYDVALVESKDQLAPAR
ncbi:MAG: hypothetical protein V7641_3419 [Blastocatellia bacterium]